MCIPPADENPAPHFALLAKLAGETGLSVLSMGMSGDFEIAIRFGATHVRVGSAIFGAETYQRVDQDVGVPAADVAIGAGWAASDFW